MLERVTTGSVAFSSIFALGFALAGCTGMVAGSDGPGGSAPNGSGANGGAGSVPTGSAGTGTGSGASAGTTTGTGGAGGTAAIDVPGASLMHRLNTAEYNATITDVLGTKLQPATENWRGGEVDGFDNIASVLGMDSDQFGLYVDAADQISQDVFASDALRAKVLTCTTTDDMTCVKNIITATGLRVFRRPVLDAEVANYTAVYKGARAQGEDHTSSIRHVLWSLLSSAEFLYRMEFDAGATAKHPVSGYELASRLSYFLWSSAPDDALLASAATLNADAPVSTAVDRMLTDTKSSRLVTNFAGQWLGARNIVAHPVDKTVYPAWSTDVANAASQEMFSYFDEFLRKDLPWTDFLKDDFNFVNAALAPFYGISGVTGTAPTRTVYAPDNRAGFMSLVGFLANSSVAGRSSPTLRGKWVLVNLLCAPPPPPPPGVPKLEDGAKNPTSTNVRTILEAHRSAAACNACHSIMDPFGLAMEQYDGIGKFRTTYPDMSAIDPSTELPVSTSFPMGLKFSGLDGAETATATDPRFMTCVSEKLYTYGLGRSLSTEDKTNADNISKAWQAAGPTTLSKLVHGLAGSDAFRTRTPVAQ